MKTTKRVLYFDILNICACFCVICLHCNGAVHYLYENSHVWHQALLVETVCYWAVPVFLMLTGATLLNYRNRYSTKVFFQKRLMRTVVPWFFWSGVIFFSRLLRGRLEEGVTVIDFIPMLLNNQIESVYWFFPVLFSIYLAIPVLATLLEIKNARTIFWYMFLLGFVTYSVFPVVFKLWHLSWNSAFNFPLLGGGYILFVILGYLISTEENRPKYRYIIYFLAILSMVFRYVGTIILSMQDHALNKTLFGYIQFHSVILAVAVFLFFKHFPFDRFLSSWSGILSKLSACSLGIYLIHKIVMSTLIRLFSVSVIAWQWRYLAPFLIYSICLCIVLVLKKVPIVRNVVP